MKARYLQHVMDLSASADDNGSSNDYPRGRDDVVEQEESSSSAAQEEEGPSSTLPKNSAATTTTPEASATTDASSLDDDSVENTAGKQRQPQRPRQRRRQRWSWCMLLSYRLFTLVVILSAIAVGIMLGYPQAWEPTAWNNPKATVQSVLEQQLARLQVYYNESTTLASRTTTVWRYYWATATTTVADSVVNASMWPPALGGASIGTGSASSTGKTARRRLSEHLAAAGASAHFPVVIVHGFVTSGLEVWRGAAGDTAKSDPHHHDRTNPRCALPFRQRVWAALYGARSFFQDPVCWHHYMRLNPHTGMDPVGVKLRAAAGPTAIDYFLANYWVFAKMIHQLADLGYAPDNMVVETYDWRLSFRALQERDGYLTHLRHRIEALVETHGGRKVVLTSHSMGVLLVHYFFAWVTTDKAHGGGGGGADWVDRYVHAFVNIAGSHLGVPKAATALLSGDLSDLVTLTPVANLLENFFGRLLRRGMWSTWGSIWMMLPKAPEKLWGAGADLCRASYLVSDESTANEGDHDDVFCPWLTHDNNNATVDNDKDDKIHRPSPLLAMSDMYNETVQWALRQHDNDTLTSLTNLEMEFIRRSTHSTREAIDFLKAYGAGYGERLANAAHYSYHEHDGSIDEDDDISSPRTWHDPTRTRLPYAPNLKIYCLYGVGIETERAYYYKRNVVHEGNQSILEEPAVVLDPSVQDANHHVHTGIRYVDGDGSVPLLSLGYICADAWQRPSSGLNPSGVKVFTREYQHRPEFVVEDPMRGGPHSADHVDILGNEDVLLDLARIVTDFEVEKVDRNHIVSDIERIAAATNQRGGIFADHHTKKKKQNNPLRGLFGFLGRSRRDQKI